MYIYMYFSSSNSFQINSVDEQSSIMMKHTHTHTRKTYLSLSLCPEEFKWNCERCPRPRPRTTAAVQDVPSARRRWRRDPRRTPPIVAYSCSLCRKKRMRTEKTPREKSSVMSSTHEHTHTHTDVFI